MPASQTLPIKLESGHQHRLKTQTLPTPHYAIVMVTHTDPHDTHR
jgi:hypothetical protein